jgi:hypothetical protein
MPSQATYQYRPYTLPGHGRLAKPGGEHRAPALAEAGAPRGRKTLGLLLESVASVLQELEGNFMRRLAIGRGVRPPSPGENMPLRLPDARFRTAWAGRPSATAEAGPDARSPGRHEDSRGQAGEPRPAARAS